MANNINFNGQTTIGSQTINQGVQADRDATATRQAQENISVLFALANPHGTDPLLLNTELWAIEEALRHGEQGTRLRVRKLLAATVEDLRLALREKPAIVHLAGHGTSGGFVLEDAQRRPFVIAQEKLAQLFSNYQGSLRCVILNACYTLTSGLHIALNVPYVIAVEGPIHDQAARAFSAGFYSVIGTDLDIERAFQEGRSAVSLAGLERDFAVRIVRG